MMMMKVMVMVMVISVRGTRYITYKNLEARGTTEKQKGRRALLTLLDAGKTEERSQRRKIATTRGKNYLRRREKNGRTICFTRVLEKGGRNVSGWEDHNNLINRFLTSMSRSWSCLSSRRLICSVVGLGKGRKTRKKDFQSSGNHFHVEAAIGVTIWHTHTHLHTRDEAYNKIQGTSRIIQ